MSSIAIIWALGCSDSGKGEASTDDAGYNWDRDTGTGAPDTGTGAKDTGAGEDTGTGEDTSGPDTGTAEEDTGTGEAVDTASEVDTGTGNAEDTGTGLDLDGGDTDTDTGAPDTETDTAADTGPADGGQDVDGSVSDTGSGEEPDTGDYIDAGVCVELDLFIERRPVRVMILEDRSLSMDETLPEGTSKWNVAVGAISGLVQTFDDRIQFGLDVFTALDAEDYCTVGMEVLTDVAPGNASGIADTLSGITPANATPLLLAMQNFTNPAYAPVFSDGAGDSYLIIVSDGMDTCGQEGVFNRDGGASADELAAATSQILSGLDIKTYVIGFGDGIDPDQLDAIAREGGTGRDTYYDAADSAELDNVLNEIGEAVAVSCTFDIGEYDENVVDLDYVNIEFDGVKVPRDDGCAANTGWTWVDDTRTAISFCEQSCAELKGTAVEEVSVTIACTPDDIIII